MKKQSALAAKLAPLWNVLTEPIFTDYFTPRAGQAFESMESEMNRINYRAMFRKGSVRMVRRRNGGGYYTILTPPDGASQTKRVAFRSRFVHIAVGYPGLRFLPDLQEYRTKYNDYSRVVNAYEPHEHVYEDLKRKPGVVVVRGGGIVASRVLQRLIDDREPARRADDDRPPAADLRPGQARAEPDQAAHGGATAPRSRASTGRRATGAASTSGSSRRPRPSSGRSC